MTFRNFICCYSSVRHIFLGGCLRAKLSEKAVILRSMASEAFSDAVKVHADRKFYDLPDSYAVEYFIKKNRGKKLVSDKAFFKYINDSVIGKDATFVGPYGRRPVTYCDYTASGKSLTFIEEFIAKEVLPMYGNTHTTTSVTALQSTLFRHEARDLVRSSVNASENDSVVFVGTGVTGAVHKLLNALDLHESPVVFIDTFAHHSTLLPWRETHAEIIRIPETQSGLLDTKYLEQRLKEFRESSRKLIGCFSAASNITGILADDIKITILLHRYGALAFWDYATAAPYTQVDMNPVVPSTDQSLAYKDAIFLSPHKFVGGPETPGVLVAKKRLFANAVPSGCGGGSVFFVSRTGHRYLKEIEMREEGGTPSIIGAIRCGLVFQLKDSIDPSMLELREKELCRKALNTWKESPNLVVLGSTTVPRLPILSFLIRHPKSGLFLHHNFICALLNDLYGIQTRGGCACAGPYAQDLLGIDEQLALEYEKLLAENRMLDRTHLRRYMEYSEREVLRPGFVRLNLPYFMPDDEVDFVLSAVKEVSELGWTLLPQYNFNPETGEWKHLRHQVFKDRKWLGSISYLEGKFIYRRTGAPEEDVDECPMNKQELLSEAKIVYSSAAKAAVRATMADQDIMFDSIAAKLRWFLLPSEARNLVLGNDIAFPKLPFTPPSLKDLPEKNIKPAVLDTSVAVNGHAPETCRPCAETADSDCTVNESKEGAVVNCHWHSPPKKIFKPFLKAVTEFSMVSHKDRVLVCLSGGKDSLSLLHTMKQYQHYLKNKGICFDLGAVTVDPGSSSYDPRPLKKYLAALGVPYFYEEQCIVEQAAALPECTSICSFCSRMKRGRIYACARREGYNVLALGQHLDDLTESFVMSIFHNGCLRTMKANYVVREGDLRVTRPFVYVREKDLRKFAEQRKLPVIAENCPACFEAPKERHRVKQLLAAQEILFPKLFWSLSSAMHPLMAISKTGVEGALYRNGVKTENASDSDDD